LGCAAQSDLAIGLNFILEGNTFRIIFPKPGFGGGFARKQLQMISVPDLLADVDRPQIDCGNAVSVIRTFPSL
jgi:hypothetical protein